MAVKQKKNINSHNNYFWVYKHPQADNNILHPTAFSSNYHFLLKLKKIYIIKMYKYTTVLHSTLCSLEAMA